MKKFFLGLIVAMVSLPQLSFGQDAAGTNQPSVGAIQPSVDEHKHNFGENRVSAGTDQPSAGTNQAPAGTSPTPDVTNQPPAETNQAPVEASQPSAVTNTPPAFNAQLQKDEIDCFKRQTREVQQWQSQNVDILTKQDQATKAWAANINAQREQDRKMGTNTTPNGTMPPMDPTYSAFMAQEQVKKQACMQEAAARDSQ